MRAGIQQLVFLLSFLGLAGSVGAQVIVIIPPTVTVSTGYSNVQMQRANNLFYNHNGAYVDGDVAWQLPLNLPLQAGFGVTGSGYWDRQSTNLAINDNYYFYDDNHLYSDAGLFELEPRLGLRLGGTSGLFITPRIGAGLLISNYAVDQTFTSNGNTYISTDYHTGAAFEVRPAIQLGWDFGRVSAGAEASYLYSWGNFGGFGRNAREYRIGAFVKFSF